MNDIHSLSVWSRNDYYESVAPLTHSLALPQINKIKIESLALARCSDLLIQFPILNFSILCVVCPATQLDLLIAWNIPYWFGWNLAAESSAFRILHTACACARVLHSSIQHSNRMQLFGVTFTSIFQQIELIFSIDFLLRRFKYFGIIITSPAFQTPRTSLIVVNVFIFSPPPSNAQIENRKLLL